MDDNFRIPGEVAGQRVLVASGQPAAWVEECRLRGAREIVAAEVEDASLACLLSHRRFDIILIEVTFSGNDTGTPSQLDAVTQRLERAGFGNLDLVPAHHAGNLAVAARVDPSPSDPPSRLYALHYEEHLGAVEIVQAHRLWGRRYDPPPCRPSARVFGGTKIRVGFVSQDLRRNHPVLFFLRPLLKHLDSGRIEVVLYSATPEPDGATEQLRRLALLRHIAPLSDAGAAQLIRMDGVDVLVDLCGHLKNSRLAIFAHRPAPVQLSWLAYPNTSGLSAIDYRLTDAVADPPCRPAALDAGDPVLRLRSCFLCYEPPPDCPPVSALPASFQNYVTFGVFNNPAKIAPLALRTWARILQRMPSVRLLFHHGISSYHDANGEDRRRITRALLDCAINPERFSFVGNVSFLTGLELYSKADIALDTFPYNGTTTTCESMWMGLPVVHLAGESHVARVTTTLLHHARMPRLIASSVDEYVEVAINLASDLESLARFRASARAMLSRSPLLDYAAFARDFEKLVAEGLAAVTQRKA